jgi:hypothetical protein
LHLRPIEVILLSACATLHFSHRKEIAMTTLLLRGLSAILPSHLRAPVQPTARPLAAQHWMTPEIRRNMGVRARRLMRSGD